MTMIAPMRAVDNCVAATAISSIVSSAPSGVRKYRKNGARPKCASARRISAWNSTMAAKTIYGSRFRMSQSTVCRWPQREM